MSSYTPFELRRGATPRVISGMVASGRSLSDGDAGDGEKKNTMRALPILRPRQCSQDERDDWNDTFHNAVDRVPMIKAAFRYAMPSKSEIADKLKDVSSIGRSNANTL